MTRDIDVAILSVCPDEYAAVFSCVTAGRVCCCIQLCDSRTSMLLYSAVWQQDEYAAVFSCVTAGRVCCCIQLCVASLLITGGHFPQILDFFQGLKLWVPSSCVEETSIFEIMMTLLYGQSSNVHGKSTRFSQTDDIQDFSAWTVGVKVTF